jgi:hypothetical protein
MLKKGGKEHKDSIKNFYQELSFAIPPLAPEKVQDSFSPPKRAFLSSSSYLSQLKRGFSCPLPLFPFGP